jgi:hypothetical protein
MVLDNFGLLRGLLGLDRLKFSISGLRKCQWG